MSRENRRGRLCFTVGLPRSGKTTFADRWAREGPAGGNPRAVIAGDDFRLALHGRAYVPEAEGVVFASMDVAARALLSRGFDVLMDETCTTRSTLLRYLKLDPDASPLFFEAGEAECVARALATGRAYLVGPIRRMAGQLAELRSDWDATVGKLRGYARERRGVDEMV